MKYGKLINNSLDIKEVEKGIEVGGTTTEQQLIEQGYKPLCEIEKPEGAEYFVYREYDTCFVQEWRMKDEPLQEGDIWTSDSGVDPSFNDILRIQNDMSFISNNINNYHLSEKEAVQVKFMYPKWEVGLSVKKEERYEHLDKLYEVDQDHTTQENWAPDKQSSLWHEVSYHEGTKEDPIPYNESHDPQFQGMVLELGKFYTQDGITYECIRDSQGVKIVQDLAGLVDNYVAIVDKYGI